MRFLSTTLFAALATVAVVPVQADSWDKLTNITVNEPVRLPTITLQPGNYSLKLMEDSGNRHVVQVRDADGKGLAIILALPNYQLVPKDKTVLTYWETPAGQPRAIRSWFYPGDNFGQEFAYPKSEAVQISSYSHTNVPTVPDNSNDLKSAQVTESDNTPYVATAPPAPAPAPQTATQVEDHPAPAPEPQVIAQATPPPAPAAPPPVDNPAPAVQPDTTTTPDQLPKTASPLPWIGLIGGFSLAAFLVATFWKRSSLY
jgi:hypothetical protein